MDTTNVILRIKKKEVHRAAVKLAKQKNQSLNGLINTVLEEAVKKPEKKIEKSLE